jgi:hypothetical protein
MFKSFKERFSGKSKTKKESESEPSGSIRIMNSNTLERFNFLSNILNRVKNQPGVPTSADLYAMIEAENKITDEEEKGLQQDINQARLRTLVDDILKRSQKGGKSRKSRKHKSHSRKNNNRKTRKTRKSHRK